MLQILVKNANGVWQPLTNTYYDESQLDAVRAIVRDLDKVFEPRVVRVDVVDVWPMVTQAVDLYPVLPATNYEFTTVACQQILPVQITTRNLA